MRGPGLKILSLGGVPVYIGASWLILAAVIVAVNGPSIAAIRPDLGALAYVLALGYALLLLLSVLVHEGAHALAARSFGMHVQRVVADLWGGHTAFETTHARPGSTAVTAAAGPLANLALAAAAYPLWAALGPGLPGAAARMLMLMNLALALFNLLPGLPLDGGQLVDAAVWKATGSRGKGRVAAGWTGRLVAIGVLVWFVLLPFLRHGRLDQTSTLWMLLIAFFLWRGATDAIHGGMAVQALGAVPLASVLRTAYAVAPGTPLAEVPRGVVPVVTDEQGRLRGCIDASDVAGVPEPERAGVAAGALLRARPEGWVVEANPQEGVLPVVAAMQTTGSDLVAVTWQGRLVGVATAEDVGRALGAN